MDEKLEISLGEFCEAIRYLLPSYYKYQFLVPGALSLQTFPLLWINNVLKIKRVHNYPYRPPLCEYIGILWLYQKRK